jgi:glycosyltransferase involved in cell wall biosynthesis
VVTTSAVPHVSFLALCYNHAPYLQKCLDSILAQNWPNAEIVVLDNASTDESRALIEEWARTCPHPVKLLLETECRGICANVNLLLAQAAGEFVALISTDDYWFPEKTARQVELLQDRGEEYGVAYADALRIDAQGLPLEQASFISAHRALETLPEGDLLVELLRGPFIPSMSTMIRRQALLEMGAFDETLIYEDYDAWLRLAERWKFAANPEKLSAYRVLPTSMIQTVAAQTQPIKLLSDARIMAKASLNPALEKKVVTNLHRRVLRLASEAASMAPHTASTLQAIYAITPLPGLRVMAAQERLFGSRSLEAIQTTLIKAEGRSLPQTDDDAAWQQFFHDIESIVKASEPPKSWWRRLLNR